MRFCSFDKAFEEELKFFPRSAGIEYTYERDFKYKKITVMNNAWNNLFKIRKYFAFLLQITFVPIRLAYTLKINVKIFHNVN